MTGWVHSSDRKHDIQNTVHVCVFGNYTREAKGGSTLLEIMTNEAESSAKIVVIGVGGAGKPLMIICEDMDGDLVTLFDALNAGDFYTAGVRI